MSDTQSGDFLINELLHPALHGQEHAPGSEACLTDLWLRQRADTLADDFIQAMLVRDDLQSAAYFLIGLGSTEALAQAHPKTRPAVLRALLEKVVDLDD